MTPEATADEANVSALKLQVANRLAYAVADLFDDYPLLVKMLARMPRVEISKTTPGIKTIAVGFPRGSNKVHLFYDYRFLARSSDAKLTVLLIHEMLHVGLKHLLAMASMQDPKVGNLAADILVNASIREYKELPKKERDGITQDARYPDDYPDPTLAGELMFPCLLGLDLRKESLESIYRRLMDHPEQTAPLLEGMEQQRLPQFDDHTTWDDLSAEEKSLVEALFKDAVKALRPGEGPGALPGDMMRMVEEIQNVKFNWRPHISMFAQSVSKDEHEASWRRPNRRMGPSAPARSKSYRTRLLVVIDNSGSITKALYELFMGHVLALSKMCEEVVVIGVDTAVNCEAIIKDGRMPEAFDLKSGGGTFFQPAFDYAKNKKFDGIVYLTDGEADPPSNTYRIPAVFAIAPGGKPVPGFKNVNIE